VIDSLKSELVAERLELPNSGRSSLGVHGGFLAVGDNCSVPKGNQ